MMTNKTYSEKHVAILGCTGSVGKQAVEALSAMGCRIVLLSCGRNVDEMARLAALCRPEAVAAESVSLGDLGVLFPGTNTKLFSGESGICEAIRASEADVIVHAVAGLAGLPYAIAAAETGARIAMANKEVIISAGDLIREKLEVSGGELIPVDSEHSAVFQCLASEESFRCLRKEPPSSLRRIILTASGGPFYGKTADELDGVTVREALAHPTWKMGGKITVDCATMMNKGFEVIEASRLFGAAPEQIDVLIHRQSVVHSMVEFKDRAVMAQLGLPDMRTCIRYAVSYPSRADVEAPSLDLLSVARLTFEEPDNKTFPLLAEAYDALKRGGTAPASLIAADEEAVEAFMRGNIHFNDISSVVSAVIHRIPVGTVSSFDDVFRAVAETRKIAGEELRRFTL